MPVILCGWLAGLLLTSSSNHGNLRRTNYCVAKTQTIRGRVNDVLKERVANYIAMQSQRGRSVDESSLVRDAVVEYLDKHDSDTSPAPRHLTLNEVSSSPAAATGGGLTTALEKAVVSYRKKAAAKKKGKHP